MPRNLDNRKLLWLLPGTRSREPLRRLAPFPPPQSYGETSPKRLRRKRRARGLTCALVRQRPVQDFCNQFLDSSERDRVTRPSQNPGKAEKLVGLRRFLLVMAEQDSRGEPRTCCAMPGRRHRKQMVREITMDTYKRQSIDDAFVMLRGPRPFGGKARNRRVHHREFVHQLRAALNQRFLRARSPTTGWSAPANTARSSFNHRSMCGGVCVSVSTLARLPTSRRIDAGNGAVTTAYSVSHFDVTAERTQIG